MSAIETRRTHWHELIDGPWYPSLQGGGLVAYRIWVQRDGHRWFQRHEWRRADGSTEMDDWIPGVGYWTGEMEVVEE